MFKNPKEDIFFPFFLFLFFYIQWFFKTKYFVKKRTFFLVVFFVFFFFAGCKPGQIRFQNCFFFSPFFIFLLPKKPLKKSKLTGPLIRRKKYLNKKRIEEL
jgi:hypothetical protein